VTEMAKEMVERCKPGRSLTFLGLLCLAVGTGAIEGEWPQFRGPNRDGISAETGLLKKWPAEGPKLLWTAKGIG